MQAKTDLPTLQEIELASQSVYRVLSPTPQYRWPLLEAELGAELWVKHENHTPTGSFKARTAAAYIDAYVQQHPHTQTFVTATRGNHGQAVALAAARHQRQSLVCVPIGNSVEKNAAMRAQGAELIEYGADFQAAKEHAMLLAEQSADSLHYVPSFHPLIVAGVASYWMELFRAVANIDVAFVPIGQGSGFCAAVAAKLALQCGTQIIGVVSTHAPAYALSFQAGHAVSADATTRLADGMACRVPDPASLSVVLKHAAQIVSVTDAEVANAMRLYFSATHNVIEGAGAAPLAAALQLKSQLSGKRVAVIACGGNVDRALYAEVLR
jgi:threonine dehydratase